MPVESGLSVRVSRVVAGDPARVFAAWTRPELLRQWSCPEGAEVEDAQVDLRVGGAYRIRMTSERGVHTAFGTYREITPSSRLVYTWDWEEAEFAVGETLVTVEFAKARGGTQVVLTHERLPDEEARQGHGEGWESCFNRLERLQGAGGTP